MRLWNMDVFRRVFEIDILCVEAFDLVKVEDVRPGQLIEIRGDEKLGNVTYVHGKEVGRGFIADIDVHIGAFGLDELDQVFVDLPVLLFVREKYMGGGGRVGDRRAVDEECS